jgi:hypothetical protein
MSDYKIWVAQAEHFSSALKARLGDRVELHFVVDPPLASADFQQLEAGFRLPLPEELRQFIEVASSRLRFRYVWEHLTQDEQEITRQAIPMQSYLYGGADLCPVEELSDHLDSCREWGEDTWIAEFEAESNLWLNSFPFATLDNGDYLAIGLHEEGCRPVVYLSHDDSSRPLAPSFPEFLRTWESLCYIGPEIWMLEPFTDPMTGYLNSETEKAKLLRQLFETGTELDS